MTIHEHPYFFGPSFSRDLSLFLARLPEKRLFLVRRVSPRPFSRVPESRDSAVSSFTSTPLLEGLIRLLGTPHQSVPHTGFLISHSTTTCPYSVRPMIDQITRFTNLAVSIAIKEVQ